MGFVVHTSAFTAHRSAIPGKLWFLGNFNSNMGGVNVDGLGKNSYHKFNFIRFYGNIFCSIYPFIINKKKKKKKKKKTEVKFLARQLGLDSAGTFIPYPNHIFKDAFVLQTSAREIRKCLVARLLQQGYRYHKL